MEIYEKLEKLYENLKELESAAVAFSGGVDSAFLLRASKNALGENVIAVTARAAVFPKRETEAAAEFCRKENIRHFIFEHEVFKTEGFAENPPNRCYLCKSKLFKKMKKTALEQGIKNIIEGSNTDDDGDYRPGHAAIREQGIRSPLREVGFSKEEIRQLSREMSLPTWNKPSLACLASRFPYGEEITREKLERAERGEEFLTGLGFNQVRVRIHGNIARIEAEKSEFSKILENCGRISVYFKEIGFDYTAMDLEGYRTGSMNEVLK